jgi:DUF4097 and DUF4098 domain-containing protein YvlB
MKISLAALAIGLGAALLAAPRPAGAQTTMDTVVAVRPGARFELQNISGTVQVRVTRRAEIRVHVEYDRARIEFDASPSAVSVRTVPRRNGGDAAYTIEVPVNTPLTVNGISSDIEVQGVCGEAELQSVSGDVHLTCAQGNVSVTSVSGDVTLADARGRVEISSTSGNVTVQGARADLAAHSVSGDVVLERIEGREVTAETVSGEVGFAGPIREGGRYRFQSHSGDVTLRPDGALNATVSVSTFSGDLESDFPVTLSRGGRLRPREFEFTVGSGSARLTLSSFSGTIYLRRAGAAPTREEEQ